MEMMFRSMMEEPQWKSLGRGCKPMASHTRMMTLLRRELRMVAATDVVIEAGFEPHQIRNDGMPYSNAKPRHSTVRLSFKKGGKMALSFTSGGHGDWVINLYLIAMTLERLRAIDRYGTTSGTEQYRGWSQLPPGGTSIAAAEWTTVEGAVRWLASIANVLPPAVIGMWEITYRQAAKKAHPDAGGSNELMSKVNRAKEFIEKHAGVAA